jgi:hypothetical protein
MPTNTIFADETSSVVNKRTVLKRSVPFIQIQCCNNVIIRVLTKMSYFIAEEDICTEEGRGDGRMEKIA